MNPTKGGHMQKKQEYTTVRVRVDTRKDLEYIAAFLTMKTGTKQDLDAAAEFAVNQAKRDVEMSTAIKH